MAAAFLMNGSPGRLPALSITADRPALLFSEYLFDYGPVPVEPQPLLTPTIEFRNVSDRPVTVGEITASCGCVQPRVSASTVAPGAVERITIPIRTTGEPPGPREYSVTMAWTDSRPRQATLTVRVVLPRQQVLIEPRVLGIVGSASRAIEHTVRVTDFRADPLLVETVRSSSSLISAEVLRHTVDEDGSRSIVAVRVTDGTPPGIHRAVVQFQTNDPDHPHLHLPVLLQGGPRPPDQRITVRPELLRLRGTDLGSPPQRLMISVPAAWQISHLECFPPELRTSLTASDASDDGSRDVRIDVSLADVPAGRPDDGVITLVADDGRQRVSVPVSLAWPDR